MIDIDILKPQIIEQLKPLNPYKIILFGSYATGNPTEDSDIDLYVVTDDDFMPKNWKEKNQIYLQYARALRDLCKSIPIDLIVHTRKMYAKFIELDSSFYRYNIKQGKSLW